MNYFTQPKAPEEMWWRSSVYFAGKMAACGWCFASDVGGGIIDFFFKSEKSRFQNQNSLILSRVSISYRHIQETSKSKVELIFFLRVKLKSKYSQFEFHSDGRFC